MALLVVVVLIVLALAPSEMLVALFREGRRARRYGRSRVARVALAMLALADGGCCSEPWNAFPESTKPDRSCSTGHVQGNDVYIWNCLRGKHVIVTQYSAEMSCQEPQRMVTTCGTETELEKSLALKPEVCRGPRSGREWR